METVVEVIIESFEYILKCIDSFSLILRVLDNQILNSLESSNPQFQNKERVLFQFLDL